MKTREERFFIIVLLLALTGIAVITGAIWYLQVVGLTTMTKVVLTILAVVFSLVFLIFAVGFGSIFLTLVREKPISWFISPTRLAVEYLFPLALNFGHILGFEKEVLQRAFIAVSNHLVGIKGIAVKGEEIMILLPHCIQKSDCQFKVTNNVENCRRCGRCPIDDIIKLKEKYNCHVAVATGGTLARKIIKEIRPKAIVAVACERDLSSGLMDTYPLPVTGVLNIRPEGPCINTLVDVKKLENAILQFIGR